WEPYLRFADKYDQDLVEGWRDDMDTLLIFAALFSASVTAFVIESAKSLQIDPNQTMINVLLHISQQLANDTHTSATLPSNTFHPASSDIDVNIFWFLSLAFSLSCALAAVLVKQWARHYLRVPRDLSSSLDKVRKRQLLFDGMTWWKLELVVDMIPVLLHISLILFFFGLLLFLRAVN
ncbi:hypothetical protein BD410DRAFT_700633, partial [Rickenella mellea]